MKNKLLLLAVVVIVGALLYYCFNTGSKVKMCRLLR